MVHTTPYSVVHSDEYADTRSPRRATARLPEQQNEPTARSCAGEQRVTWLPKTDIRLRCDPRVACAPGSEAGVGEERAFTRRPCSGRHGSSEYEVSTVGLDLRDAEGLDMVEAVGRQPVQPNAVGVGVGVDDLVEVMESVRFAR